MAIRFEWYKTPSPTNEDKEHYHARPVLNGTTETEEIARDIQARSSLTDIDTEAVLDAVSTLMGEHLANGRRVHIKGIGYFQITLTCNGEDIQADTKRRNTKVRMKSISFTPDLELKKNIGPIKLEHVKTQDHSTPLSAAEVDARVEAYFHTHESISRAILQGLCHFTSITANRHLRRLQEEGKIKNINWKHQPIYVWAK